jgi:hypothetical protein
MTTTPKRIGVAANEPKGSDWQQDRQPVNKPTSGSAQPHSRAHRRSGLSRSEERHRLTRPAAQRLAARIAEYWQAQGHKVRCWIEPIDGTNEWAVRSTLVLSGRRP